MPKSIDYLVITDAVCGSKSSSCTMADVGEIARLLYGSPIAAIRAVRTNEELVRALGEYMSIRRLIFMLEGANGEMAVNHHYRNLSWYAAEVMKLSPRPIAHEIFFDNCNVVNDPDAVAAFMAALRATRSTGSSSFHVWMSATVKVASGTSPAQPLSALRVRVPGWDVLREYLLPGQPSIEQMVSRPGTRIIYFEFFTREPPSEALRADALRGASQFHGLVPRSRLVPKKIIVGSAPNSAADLDLPAGPIYMVTYQSSRVIQSW